ncbi:hypothetical protein BH24DEI2_BH24DEI2_07510 [soil metagenome]
MANEPEDKKGVKTYKAPERKGPSISIIVSTLAVLALVVFLLLWVF